MSDEVTPQQRRKLVFAAAIKLAATESRLSREEVFEKGLDAVRQLSKKEKGI